MLWLYNKVNNGLKAANLIMEMNRPLACKSA